MVRRRHYFPALTAFFMGTLAPAYGQDVIIVTAPGGSADVDDARLLTAQDIEAVSGPDVLRALSTQVAGVSLSRRRETPISPASSIAAFPRRRFKAVRRGLPFIWMVGGLIFPLATRSILISCSIARLTVFPCATATPFMV